MRSFPASFYHNSRKEKKTMTKSSYMALADFQTLWTNQIKPEIPTIAGTPTFATPAECRAIVTGYTPTPPSEEQ